MRAIAYLQLHLLKNGVLSVLRSPKRLVFALLFIGWIGMSVLLGFTTHMSGYPSARLLQIPSEYLRLGAISILIILTLTAIERGLEGTMLSFAAADYDFLFPSPVGRRLVVASKVLVDTVTTFFWVGVFITAMVFFVPVRLIATDLTFASLSGLWLASCLYAVFVVNLSRIVELFLAGGQAALGVSVNALKTTVWVLGAALLIVSAYLFAGGSVTSANAVALLNRPPISYLLLPVLSVASFITGDPSPIGSAAGDIALLFVLAGGCLVGVCALDQDVIETTIEHSVRVSRLRAAARSQDVERILGERMRDNGKGRRSFLVSWRSPQLAFMYKNLAELSHGGRFKLLGYVLLMGVGAPLAMIMPNDQIARYAPGPVVAYLLLLFAGVQSMRVRSELNHSVLLRTLPLPPWRQVLDLVLPRTLLQSLLIMGAMGCFWLGRPIPNSGLNLGVALTVPAAVLVTYLMAAVTACVFPSLEDPAQRFLGGLLLMIGASIALAPAITLVIITTLMTPSGLLVGLMGNLGALPVAAALVACAAFFFSRFEPGDE